MTMVLQELQNKTIEKFFLIVREQYDRSCKKTIMGVVLEDGENYIDLSEMQILNQDECNIILKKPLSDYFTEEDYGFDEDEEGIYFWTDEDIWEEFVSNHMYLVEE